ncbi:MAG TPA: ATP-binding protein [Planctomycetota bacterium]|nr:ATP-binding protein [Planctomycetota bacterium]
MFRKLIAATLGLLLLALALFGVLSAQATRTRLMDEMSRRLSSDAEILRLIVATTPQSGPLQSSVQDLSRRLEARFTVIDGEGRVLADSDNDPAGMDNHNNRSEVRQARQHGKGSETRYSDTMRTEMLYFARLIEVPPGTVVRAALPLTRVQEEVGGIYRTMVIAFAGIAIVAAAVMFLIAREITQPLREMRILADWVAAGDFTRKAPLRAPDEIGHVSAALNRMADELTARLDKLRAERSKLEAVISSMEEGVIPLDPDGKILGMNAAAKELFGLRDDPQGLKLWEVIRLPGLEEAATKTLRNRTPVTDSFEVGDRVLSVRLSPVTDGAGAVLVAHDITEDRRYDTLRKEFVANVSHELRTPLTVVQGYVETLTEGAWKDEKSSLEFLSIIDKNVRRLSAIVSDLLDLSKLESGGQVLERREVDVRGIVDRVAEAFRPVAARKQQQFSAEVGPGTGGLRADGTLLERALSNLVDNALKYTPEKGKIRVWAGPEDGHVVMSVEDNGGGIPEADLPRIFERFYRVDKSRSRDLGGTGLGLSIVKHIIQLHGGTISVRSTPAGSTFTIRLPVRTEA